MGNLVGDCAGATVAPAPMLVKEVNRLDRVLAELGTTVNELRNALDIQDAPPPIEPANKTPAPHIPHKVENRAKDFSNLTDRLEYMVERLQPVLSAVGEI